MSLSSVQPFLEQAFDFLCDRKFSVTQESWKIFYKEQGVTSELLKSAKLELLTQLNKPEETNKTEILRKLFCCDPFDQQIVKDLRDIWSDNPEPFKGWSFDLAYHLISISDSSKSEVSQLKNEENNKTIVKENTIYLPSSPPQMEIFKAIATGGTIGAFVMISLVINNYFNKQQPSHQTSSISSSIVPDNNKTSSHSQKTKTDSPSPQKVSNSKSSTTKIPKPNATAVQENSIPPDNSNHQITDTNSKSDVRLERKSESSSPDNSNHQITEANSKSDVRSDRKSESSYTSKDSVSSSTNAKISGRAGYKNIRSGAGTRYSTIHTVRTGERLRIIGSSLDEGGYRWYEVYFPEAEVKGWIAAQLITRDGHQDTSIESNLSSHAPTSNARVAGKGSGTKNIRSGPGTAYSVIGEIRVGEAIQILSKSQDRGGYVWYKIRDQRSGQQGWIAAQLVNIR